MLVTSPSSMVTLAFASTAPEYYRTTIVGGEIATKT
jgi:hypothetical protein